MLEESAAAVVFDMLLEQGHAAWPELGNFELLAIGPLPKEGALVQVFPRRLVEFAPLPEAKGALEKFLAGCGGVARRPPLGRFSLTEGFVTDPVLEGRVKLLPISLFRRETTWVAPWPVAPAFPAPGPETEGEDTPSRPWWRRLFGR